MPRKTFPWGILLGLILACCAVFWPVIGYDFVQFDDGTYVYENPHIQKGLTPEGISWAFKADFVTDSPHADYWIPLTFISHMAAAQIFGMEPGGHHLVNLVFHVLNTIILFIVLRRMTGTVLPPAFVAVLFAVHPLHVESVAWVTERKDVLSTFFMMLTLLAYAGYREKPGAWRYVLVAAAFALGLMAKPMLVTLPALLILLDFWPLARFNLSDLRTPGGRQRAAWVVVEKIPLFALSVFSAAVTFLMVREHGLVRSLEALPVSVRLGNAMVSYVSYIGKMFWPAQLAPFYPYSKEGLSAGLVAGSGILLLFITAGALRSAGTRPYILSGWLWFLLSLVPVIGIVQAGTQAFADRYTYVPLTGLFIILAWGGAEAVKQLKTGPVLPGVLSAAIILSLGVRAHVQADTWRDSESLFSHALRVTRNNEQALQGLGVERLEQGRLDEAVELFSRAIEIDPGFARAHNNLANSYFRKGAMAEAIIHYTHAVRLRPDLWGVYNNLGLAHYRQGNREKARYYFSETIRRNPGAVRGYAYLGLISLDEGKPEEAETYLKKALLLDPEDRMALEILERTRKAPAGAGNPNPK